MTPQVLEALRALSPEQIHALLQGSIAPTRTGPAKLQHVLDRVPHDQVDAVIAACAKGRDPKFLEQFKDEEREVRALEPLEQVAPVVANACRTNSSYRGKPNTHSLRAAQQYLEHRREQAKRPAVDAKDPRVDQLVSALSSLRSEVSDLRRQNEELKTALAVAATGKDA